MRHEGLIKICGVRTREEIEVCLEAGVDLLGFNFYPPSPRRIEPDAAAALIAEMDLRERAVAVTVDMEPDQLQRLVAHTNVGLVQLHGKESPQWCGQVRGWGVKVIRGIRLRDAETLDGLSGYDVDWLLLDAYVAGEPGGTGMRADATLARSGCARYPALLAGGLTPDNVADAITQAQPLGVDTATGVEAAPGQKSPERIRAFVQAARAAFAAAAAR